MGFRPSVLQLALLSICALPSAGALTSAGLEAVAVSYGGYLSHLIGAEKESASRGIQTASDAAAGLTDADAVGDSGGGHDAAAEGTSRASGLEWLVFVEGSIFLFVLDLSVLRRLASRTASHCALAVLWVLVATCFNAYVWRAKGPEQGLHWFSGYTLELMLSIDNVIAFRLIFGAYQTPRELRHKAMLLGIAGSLVCRLALFALLGPAASMHRPARAALGALLMCSGAAAAAADSKDQGDVKDALAVRLLRRCLGSRLVENYDTKQQTMFLVRDGKTCITLLAFVTLCILVVDLVFALDSVSTKVAVIPDLFNAFSSTVAATFALRSLFFVVSDLADALEGMQYGVAFVMTFIGVRLLLDEWLYLPAWSVAAVTGAVFFFCVIYSVAVWAKHARMRELGISREELM